jgi:hypothetical protein
MLSRIFILLCLFSSFIAFGQERPTLSFTKGIAIPIGSFGSKDSESDKKGYAKLGPQANISINWPLNKRFGIELMAHGQLNPIDKSALAKEFNSRGFYSPISVGYSDNQVNIIGMPASPPNWKFDKANWLTAGLLAGPIINVPINDKLTFTGKAMIGAMYVSKPKIHGTSELPAEYLRYRQDKKGSVGFSYNAYAGLKWKISDRVALNAGISYFGVPSVTFRNVHTTFNTNTSGGVATENFQSSTIRQNISSLNFHIGITIRL